MSRISRDIYTSLDVNGPYIRIDTQPISTITEHNQNGTFTLAASTYYLTGDEAEIGDIDVLEADAVAPTDASLDNQTPGVPHTAKNSGYISYQWWEISVDPVDQSETVNKLTDGTLYSGTTTNTLTVANTLSPSYHLNRYYCVLDYIPTTVGGEFDTGNAVNDAVTSDIVTLNVRPFLIINTQPITTTTFLNPDSGTASTKASLSDTRFPWNDYRLEFQWWENDREDRGGIPQIRLIDGDYTETITTSKSSEIVINEIQTTILTESITAGQSKRVGIPTEAVDVTFSVSGGAGGEGGNENSSSLGGSGGKGRTAEFKLNSAELFRINNALGPTEYLLAAGTKGGGGTTRTAANGGSGGYSFDLDTAAVANRNDSTNGGRGGISGPGGISGSGGGGGAASFIIKSEDQRWLTVAGGGGGGGGGSKDASGVGGGDASALSQFALGLYNTEVQQATVVNYNPIAGTGSNPQDKIDYGFYIKSDSPLLSPNTTDNYRVVVIWNGDVVVNKPSTKLLKTGNNVFYVNDDGGMSYFIQTYRDSQLGWCDDETNLDTVCVRGDGGYVNSFDVYRISNPVNNRILAYDGANGTDKTTGDGGGGGGGGGGAIAPTTGGSVGKDPIPAKFVDITFKVTSYASIGIAYIEFVEIPWYGVNPDTEPSRGQVIRFDRTSTTQTVSLQTNKTYDVYSHFEDGRTSDSLRILQDFTTFGNVDGVGNPIPFDGDLIAGRSIGMDLSGSGDNIQIGNEEEFRDFIVSVSDGTFDISPQTVKLDDGEIVGKAIIRFTTPTADVISVSATGGEGGASQYSITELDLISSSLNDGEGSITMTVTTEQPFDTLVEEITYPSYEIKYSIRGAHPYTPYKESGYTSNLTITSDYAFSKKIMCQISAIDTSFATRTLAATSFSNTVYTDRVDFIVLDGRNNTITVEGIRHNDNFAIISSNNLDNGDLTIERSGSTSTKEIEYYSFYSNQDLEVDIKLFGGKGNDVGSYSGGEGGFSYVRLNMEANTEYVIAGLNAYVNTPYLFKGGRLLACVGGGGDANTSGAGAPGGGVSMSGGSAYRGGVGGAAPDTLTSTGVIGSASNNNPIAPDTKALIPDGGRTIRCSKGNLFQFNGQPDPCESRGSSVKFDFGGNEITNTRQISRGFKAGYNILKTGGRNNGAVINQGWGGSGATGGQGSDSFGGGGGSGFIIPDATTDIFVRSEGNAEILASGTTLSGLQGTGQDTISSFLGGSTGNAKVVISKAEVQSRFLPEFIERPADTDLTVVEEDVVPEPVFVRLPEIVPPPPVIPPNPRMSITNVVSKGWNGGDITYNTITGQSKHFVLESGSLDVNVKTDDIPANTPFYWEVNRLLPEGGGSQYTEDDFTAMTGSFRTFKSGSLTVGSFNINPTEDSQTDFIGGNQVWRFRIYSDINRKFRVAIFSGVITTLDTSLTAPTALFENLIADGSGGNLNARTKNSISEGEPPRQINFSTKDIPNGSTVKWYIKNVTSQNADFVATSGTATVTSRFTLNSSDAYAVWNGVSPLSTANQGTGSFTIQAVEDFSTEGSQFFGLQIEYPVGSGTIIADSTTGTKKHIRINDTSIIPGATISGGTSVDEGSTLTLTVDTDSVSTDSVLYWKIFKSNNTDVDSTEFENSTGSITVNPTTLNASTSFVRVGQETFDIIPLADNLTEPTESFVVKLYRNAARTTALNTPGTSTHSTHSFNVVNTSFSPTKYGMAFGDGKKVVSGFAQYKESDGKITVNFRAWHLSPAVVANQRKIYFAVVNYSDGALADAGTVGRTTFPDFDINNGELSLVFKGYVESEGSTSSPVSTSTATKFTPYWEVSKEIIPREDYFDDGDKDFEIRLYKYESNKNKLNDEYENDALKFSVKDNSGPLYQFNTLRGYGTSDSSGINATGGTATLTEGNIHSFRIETTNVAGTLLWYSLSGTNITDNDFDDPFVGRSSGQHPGPPSGYRAIRDSRYYYVYGDLETFAPPSGDTYGTLVAGGKNLDRSIAYIYILPKEDYVKEGSETFNIDVYNDSSESSQYLVATITATINASVAPALPTITLTCDPTSVNTGTPFSVSWTVTNVSEDNLKDGGENDNSISGTSGNFGSKWFTSNSSITVTPSSPTTHGSSETYSYSATVYNSAGEFATDTASATVTKPHILGCTDSSAENYNSSATQDDGSCTYYVAPPPPVVVVPKRYRVYPLWRYSRTGSNKMDRYAHNPSNTFQDFWSKPTTMPSGTPGYQETPPFSSNRTRYTADGSLGGVFLAGDLPPGAVSYTTIQNKLDNAMSSSEKITWYCFNKSVVGSKLMNIYERDPGYTNKNKGTIGESYHLRDVGDTFGLTGWLTDTKNDKYKFYLMNGIYQEPNGTWWWNDTR